jgi:hypothetical protein
MANLLPPLKPIAIKERLSIVFPTPVGMNL